MEVDQSVVLLHVVVQSEQYVTEHGHTHRERERDTWKWMSFKNSPLID